MIEIVARVIKMSYNLVIERNLTVNYYREGYNHERRIIYNYWGVRILNIYLHEIDIDEHGAEVSLPCTLEQYLLKYVFFADGVFLQSSSSLKRQDMFAFFQRHSDLFGNGDSSDGSGYIFFVLDPRYDSVGEYIDDRLGILSRQPGSGQNIEYMIYKENEAGKRAGEVDSIVKKDDIKRRVHDVNTFFKYNLLNLNIPLEGEDFLNGTKMISEYVLQNGFVQTFELMKRIEGIVVNRESAEILGRAVRRCYFEANAAAVGCEYHNRDWRLRYNNINLYCELIGLNRIFRYNWKINKELVTKIKNLPSFRSLISIYYNFNDSKRFLAFFDSIMKKTNNPAYVFYEKPRFYKLKSLFQKDLEELKNSIVIYHEERG